MFFFQPLLHRIPATFHIPLVKYPLFLIFLNPNLFRDDITSGEDWLLLIQVFLAASIYEVIHDREYFSIAINKVIMAVEYNVLAVSLLWRSFQISPLLIKGLALSINVVGLIIGFFMIYQLNNYTNLNKIKYIPFILLLMEGALWLLNLRFQALP